MAERCISEDELANERAKQKLSDGMLWGSQGFPEIAREFAGAYDAEPIRSFHRDCRERKIV